MSEVISFDAAIVGVDTTGMVLVYNSKLNSVVVTEKGNMLGGGDKAWVSADDKVLLELIKSGVLQLLSDGKVAEEQNLPEDKPKPKKGRPPKKKVQSE